MAIGMGTRSGFAEAGSERLKFWALEPFHHDIWCEAAHVGTMAAPMGTRASYSEAGLGSSSGLPMRRPMYDFNHSNHLKVVPKSV